MFRILKLAPADLLHYRHDHQIVTFGPTDALNSIRATVLPSGTSVHPSGTTAFDCVVKMPSTFEHIDAFSLCLNLTASKLLHTKHPNTIEVI